MHKRALLADKWNMGASGECFGQANHNTITHTFKLFPWANHNTILASDM